MKLCFFLSIICNIFPCYYLGLKCFFIVICYSIVRTYPLCLCILLLMDIRTLETTTYFFVHMLTHLQLFLKYMLVVAFLELEMEMNVDMDTDMYLDILNCFPKWMSQSELPTAGIEIPLLTISPSFVLSYLFLSLQGLFSSILSWYCFPHLWSQMRLSIFSYVSWPFIFLTCEVGV